jgi:predicted nuclease of restriction endonuclease-like (RecB) superfamily
LKKAFEGRLLSEVELCKKIADYEPSNELLKKNTSRESRKNYEKEKQEMKPFDITNSPIETHFEQVHSIIDLHRTRALKVVNNESLLICWNVGQYVSEKLKASEWGSKVVTQLSEYLRTKDPSLKGYSRSSIYNMVSFFEAYSSPQFMQLTQSLEFMQTETKQIQDYDNQEITIIQTNSGQLDSSENKSTEIVQFQTGRFKDTSGFPKILSFINWTNHVEILNSCKLLEEKLFYILHTKRERFETKELKRAIKTNAYAHILKADNNQSKGMETAYPQSNYLFKDVAYLDFLGLPQKHSEKRLQKEILINMKDFILELGKDFLFIGQEYPIQVGGKTFKIDLLFFHRALQCLVAIELKTTEFEPAFMGQLEFYLEALDNDVKRSNENPSIGILLCKETNREIVRYALNRSLSPTMIAKYERELIPKEVLQQSLNQFFNFIKE